MLSLIIVIIAVVATAFLAFYPPLQRSSNWSATVTPLASIMGSGFLVSAPLLAGSVGNLAVFCIIGLLFFAYRVGGIIRFNIRHFEPVQYQGHGPAQSVAFISRIVLAAAYFISVSYYLQLLAAFSLSALGVDSPLLANIITTTLLLVIGSIGMWRGLGLLERLEKYAVSLNLGVIIALLLTLLFYNLWLWQGGQWQLAAIKSDIDFSDFRVLLGMLIIVQGFETSRYLGSEHPPEQRITTMRLAQRLSAVIYIAFIGLATVLFRDGLGGDVTAIIAMILPVAVILPVLISVAAIGSQFSAAVADYAGAGGLFSQITRGKVAMPYAYAFILLATVVLSWESNVTEIISYASRAFALYYFLQGVVALLMARKLHDLPKRRVLLWRFLLVTAGCLMVFVLGIPAE